MNIRPVRAVILLTLLVLPVAALGVGVTPAHAHAVLVRTDPADGAVLPVAPNAVRLAFNEPVTPLSGGLRVFAADGTRVDLARPPERADVSTTDRSVLAVALPDDLPDGGYVVAWRVRSADGHAIAGTLRFTVGDAAPVSDEVATALADSDAPAWVRAADRTVRGAILVGLMVAAGVAVAGLAVARTAVQRRDVSILTVRAAAVTLPLVPVALWLQGAVQAGTPAWAAVTAALAGGAEAPAALARSAGLLLLVIVARRTSPGSDAARARVALMTVVAAALALLPLATEGHQRGGGGGTGAVGTLRALLPGLDAVHVGAGALWIGAVMLLAVAVSARADTPDEVEALAARVGRVALAALGVVALTGTAQAVVLVDTPASLTTTAYGVTLVGKVALVAAAVGVAALARRRVRTVTDGGWGGARRLLRVELALLGAAVVMTGALVTLPPPVDASSSLFTAAAPLSSDLLLDVGVDTSRPGRTELHVFIIEGAALTSRTLDVRAAFTSVDGLGPLRSTPLLVEDGHWFGILEPLPPGEWLLDVTVGLDRFTERTVTFTVPVR